MRKQARTLHLNRETLRILTLSDLRRHVRGGAVAIDTSCGEPCTCECGETTQLGFAGNLQP